ncbi:hypothetical protein DPMN_146893 [Dreissena polymorpha]|uniref:Uncharacterized protein n=1 Tax=Dreissena polymorpha TaxID=45954 RepID=A0A9D4J047_DREPO|nr:hypothetical protein DPMN_146893 [Dreissena polymorpha]
MSDKLSSSSKEGTYDDMTEVLPIDRTSYVSIETIESRTGRSWKVGGAHSGVGIA